MTTETTGTLKVRTNIVAQEQPKSTSISKNLSRSQSMLPRASPRKSLLKGSNKTAFTKPSTRTLAEITERARERLKALKVKNSNKY